MAIAVNDSNFEEVVLKSAQPVLVDLWAEWCGPCKMLSPVLEGVAEKMKDKVTIVKVDVDRSPDLAAKFGVMSVPTMIMFKNGRQVDAFSGYMPEANLMANIERNL